MIIDPKDKNSLLIIIFVGFIELIRLSKRKYCKLVAIEIEHSTSLLWINVDIGWIWIAQEFFLLKTSHSIMMIPSPFFLIILYLVFISFIIMYWYSNNWIGSGRPFKQGHLHIGSTGWVMTFLFSSMMSPTFASLKARSKLSHPCLPRGEEVRTTPIEDTLPFNLYWATSSNLAEDVSSNPFLAGRSWGYTRP